MSLLSSQAPSITDAAIEGEPPPRPVVGSSRGGSKGSGVTIPDECSGTMSGAVLDTMAPVTGITLAKRATAAEVAPTNESPLESTLGSGVEGSKGSWHTASGGYSETIMSPASFKAILRRLNVAYRCVSNEFTDVDG